MGRRRRPSVAPRVRSWPEPTLQAAAPPPGKPTPPLNPGPKAPALPSLLLETPLAGEGMKRREKKGGGKRKAGDLSLCPPAAAFEDKQSIKGKRGAGAPAALCARARVSDSAGGAQRVRGLIDLASRWRRAEG